MPTETNIGTEACATCGGALDRESQFALFGVPVECAACGRIKTATHYSKLLPQPNERGWQLMAENDRKLVTAVRKALVDGQPISVPRFVWLEDIYGRYQ